MRQICVLSAHIHCGMLLGIRTEEIDCKPNWQENYIEYADTSYALKGLCALAHAESAKVLSVYKEDFYAGYPALTRNQYGKGVAYYIAAETELSFIEALYRNVMEETCVGSNFAGILAEGVTVSERIREEDSFAVLQNYGRRM